MLSIVTLEPKLLNIIMVLVKNGVRKDFILINEEKIKEMFNSSLEDFFQDTEKLIPKYLEKKENSEGISLRITSETEKSLRSLLIELQTIFFGFPPQIRGLLMTGLGEGNYYIALPEYSKQFNELLGWTPYPGTLNLRLTTHNDVEGFQRLINSPSHLINGFKHEGRTFGEVLLWKCEIQHFTDEIIEGAVIRPVRTHHSHQTIELIAPYNIRDKLNLKDEDTLIVNPNLM
ncbi:MAG: Riboflavin kinase [Candidatus Heimdallarchaeota archaeon LC_3]|nr:MAG: Riboflavin kinase [Candidatus Heimdallarchaeota archaeon LC_3]